MAAKTLRSIPLNRVEGDLEVKVEITDGVVTDAWCSGIMYRGFEKILEGRGVMDGLVITPRVCGLCSICHLKAAARALEMIAQAKVPDDAIRVRNVVNMCEDVQSDVRHGILMFCADFASGAYQGHPLHEEAKLRYEPFKGSSMVEVIQESKKMLEIIAILGGQWPHTSFIVPGGISSIPTESELLQCRSILANFRQWYERKVLGCSVERWLDVKSGADLDKWLTESDSHRNGEVGFYIRFSREAGLDKTGKGHGKFLCFGGLDMPEGTAVAPMGKGTKFIPSGYAAGTRAWWFDQAKVTEEVYHSWFEDYEGGRHPFEGETEPYATGQEGRKYSWCKAPRYDGEPAECGPLAQMIMSEQPLFKDLVSKEGPSTFNRELARLVRGALFLPAMETWLAEVSKDGRHFYTNPGKIEEGEGFGLTEAARGALGHWVKLEKGRIAKYQIITPTAWNASPRDSRGVRGPWEESLIGTAVRDVDNPVEVGHVIRSYDSCMVCCVHRLANGRGVKKVVL